MFQEQPPPTEWPYWFSPEYDIAIVITCVCDGSGWLPLPDQTMITCFQCNNHD